MDTGEILKQLGITSGALAALSMFAIWLVKNALPVFAKARLDSSSLGAAGELIKSLQEQNKALVEDHKAAMVRADEALKSERERADAARKVIEETTIELYKVREELSRLTSENIRLIGKIEEFERKLNSPRGGDHGA